MSRPGRAVTGLLTVLAMGLATAAAGPGAPSVDDDVLVQLLGDTVDAAALADRLDLPVTASFPVANAVVLRTRADRVAVLDALPGVRAVEVPEVELALESSHRAVRSRPEVVGVVADDGTPFDGRGVTIAVVDAGVDGTHAMFRRPDGTSSVVRNLESVCPDEAFDVTGSACVVDVPTNDTAVTSQSGHGTHVASVAAGQRHAVGDGRVVEGVAPGADLVAISTGTAATGLSTMAALQWVLEHHDDPCGDGACPAIRVVNNSYTTSAYDDYPDDVIARLQEAIVAEGVVMVWAAGNDGGNGATATTNPWGRSTTPGVVHVGASDDGGLGLRTGPVADFSSGGRAGNPATHPDLVAPGSFITAACGPLYVATCSIDEAAGGVFTGTASGTSVAAPHVAGGIARLLSAAPGLSPAQVEDLLEDTALPFGPGDDDEADPTNPDTPTSWDRGHGQLDVTAAIERALGLPASTPPACGELAPIAPDQPGDVSATGMGPGPAPGGGTFDLLAAAVLDRPDGGIDVVLDYVALGPIPTAMGEGQSGRAIMDLDGTLVDVSFTRTTTEASTFSVTVDTLARRVEGSIDLEQARVRIPVPAELLREAGVEPMPGMPLRVDEVRSLRVTPDGSLFVITDRAHATCLHLTGDAGTA